MIPAEAQAALLAKVRQCPVKLEWLNWDEEVVGEYTAYATAGSLTFDAGQDVRRSFTLTLENASGLFIPNDAIVNQTAKVRLRRGIQTATTTYWWSRGVYLLTDPSAVNEGGRKEVTLNGVSKWALFDGTIGGKITDTYLIPASTNVADAIQAILELRGETKFNFDDCAEVTPFEISKEPGSTYADILKDLALIPSYELFDTVDGYWRFRPLVDAAQKSIVVDLVSLPDEEWSLSMSVAADTEYSLAKEWMATASGAELINYLFDPSVSNVYVSSLYVSGTYSPSWSQIINKLKVIGYTDPTSGVTYKGAYELPSAHKYSVANIGERSDFRTHPELSTNDLCDLRAEYEVIQRMKQIDRSSHELILIPFLTELDCVQLANEDAGIPNSKHEIQRITEDLTNSVQTIECWGVE